jgi:hypothetical protein
MCTTMMVCVRAARALLGSQDISVLRGYSTGYEWTRLESSGTTILAHNTQPQQRLSQGTGSFVIQREQLSQPSA